MFLQGVYAGVCTERWGESQIESQSMGPLTVWWAVVDSGFSWGLQTSVGAPGYNFIKYSQNLHEIDKNVVERGCVCQGCPQSAMVCMEGFPCMEPNCMMESVHRWGP